MAGRPLCRAAPAAACCCYCCWAICCCCCEYIVVVLLLPLLCASGIRIIFSAESRKYYKHTQHPEPHKLRHYLPATLQQFVPAGTAVHNQQDRRWASYGGRPTEGERCMYTANTAAALPAVIEYIYIIYIYNIYNIYI